MAEDKRIRVTADSSPLQELRQGAQFLWDDLTRMEGKFKNLADETIVSIQRQIDLLKERNNLLNPDHFGSDFNTGSRIINPTTGRYMDGRTPGENLRNLDMVGLNNRNITLLDRIFTQVTRIAEILEQDSRNQTNGVLPTGDNGAGSDGGGNVPNVPPVPRNGGAIGGSGAREFSIPTSVSGLLGKLGIPGLILGAVGMLAGRFSSMYAQEYTAENRFQRENLRWNWLPFVGKDIAQVLEADRKAAQQFENAGSQRAVIRGSTFHNEMVNAINGSGVEILNPDYSVETIPARIDVNDHGTPMYKPAMTIYTNRRTGEKSTKKPEDYKEIDGDTAYNNNWYGKALGLDMSQFTQRQNDLILAAGGRPAQSSDYRLNQLMLAGHILGIGADRQEALQRTVRFGSDQKYETGSSYAVIRTFETTLRNLGKTNAEVVGTIQEYLEQFNRTSSQILERTGAVNTAAVTQTIASLRARGFEGQRLDRVVTSLGGGNISQDDVTQALLLRTARQLNPNGSLSDLWADIDEMQNGRKLAPEFFDMLKRMTGGGEMFRNVLKAVYPDLTWSDIRSLTTGKNANASGEQLLRSIQVVTDGYNKERAEQITGPQRGDTANESTKKTVEGLTAIADKLGKTIGEFEKVVDNKERTDREVQMLQWTKSSSDSLTEINELLRRFLYNPLNIIGQ